MHICNIILQIIIYPFQIPTHCVQENIICKHIYKTLMYNKNTKGTSTDHCETPDFTYNLLMCPFDNVQHVIC